MQYDARRRLWIPEHVSRAPAVHTIQNKEIAITGDVRVAGLWRWELLNRGGEVVRSNGPGWHRNLIVDTGLDAMGAIPAVAIAATGVGSNNAPPAVNQTSLGAQIGGRTSNNGGTSEVTNVVAGSYTSTVITRLFDFNEGNGNLTEIGFFSAGVGGYMHMRQLFLDASQVPTTVVKTSDFQLKITYDYRYYWYGEESYATTVDGVSRTVLQRRSKDNPGWYQRSDSTAFGYPINTTDAYLYAAGTFGGIGVDPGGSTFVASDGATSAAYVPGSFARSHTSTWGASIANTTTWVHLWLSIQNGKIGMKVDLTNSGASAGISKTNTQRFVINWRRTWGRYP